MPELCQRCDTHAGAAAGLRVMEENHAAAPPSDLFLELADFEQAREAVVERFFDLAVVRAVLDGRLRVAVRVARRVRGHRLVKRLRSSHASIAPDDDRARALCSLRPNARARTFKIALSSHATSAISRSSRRAGRDESNAEGVPAEAG